MRVVTTSFTFNWVLNYKGYACFLLGVNHVYVFVVVATCSDGGTGDKTGGSHGRRGRGRGRGTDSAENRGGGSTGEECSGARGGGSGSDDDGRSPLTYYFERADRSVSCGDFHKMPKDGEPKKGIVEFTDK
ncbi:hypothetical protein POM88_011087 [Heracleum sosnowskyi]|uniref:Uncharacterized protein n=1 Tax=Heracleum sosnowskyi TaxID=360622 RepID=A0AAD8IUV6_9APIA|nr:hypothetical protein POM88_011087 [Heracleum sosnowskyi]